MAGYTILPDTIASRVVDLQKRVGLLERPHKVGDIQFTSMTLEATALSNWLSPTDFVTVYDERGRLSGNIASVDITIPAGSTFEYQFRYYQEIPTVYSAAQIAAGSDYITLSTSTVVNSTGSEVTQTIEVDISGYDPIIEGTYGRRVGRVKDLTPPALQPGFNSFLKNLQAALTDAADRTTRFSESATAAQMRAMQEGAARALRQLNP